MGAGSKMLEVTLRWGVGMRSFVVLWTCQLGGSAAACMQCCHKDAERLCWSLLQLLENATTGMWRDTSANSIQ